jgi:hypothetical protein
MYLYLETTNLMFSTSQLWFVGVTWKLVYYVYSTAPKLVICLSAD